MITVDDKDNLYVVWSTEWVVQQGAFAPSTNGFAYSLNAGTDWSEPETQIFETGGQPLSLNDPARDYWLSVAVDSAQTIHVVAVGLGIRHVYRPGLDAPWIEGGLPSLRLEGIGPGYGFRGIAVDNDDSLHFVLPTYRASDAQQAPGLFHAVWTKTDGWSDWARATTNVRGDACGLGNMLISGGNQLHLVWFEHLEGSFGSLFPTPRGRIEIYYASLHTGAQAEPLSPLPPMPASRPILPATATDDAPKPTVATAPRATAEPDLDVKLNIARSEPLPVGGLTLGVGTTVLALAIAAGLVVLGRRR